MCAKLSRLVTIRKKGDKMWFYDNFRGRMRIPTDHRHEQFPDSRGLQLGTSCWGSDQGGLVFFFLLRRGAQEVTVSVCVCLSVCSWYLWILHSIFIILAQILRLSLNCLSTVSQQLRSYLEAISQLSHYSRVLAGSYSSQCTQPKMWN